MEVAVLNIATKCVCGVFRDYVTFSARDLTSASTKRQHEKQNVHLRANRYFANHIFPHNPKVTRNWLQLLHVGNILYK